MSAAGNDSSTEQETIPPPLGGLARTHGSRKAEPAIWLDGGVLACSCPECGAPMSIRLWLMLADCFRCGTSIELSEEQEQEAVRLLRAQEADGRADSRAAATAISPTMVRSRQAPSQPARPEVAKPRPRRSPKSAPAAPTAPPRPRRVAASRAHHGARAHIRDIYEKGEMAVLWREWFKDLPAWLISLVVHLVAMLLLGLLAQEPRDESPSITLSTSISPLDREGDQGKVEEPQEDAFEFEDPGAIPMEDVTEEAGGPTSEADPPPVHVPLEVTDPAGLMPDLARRLTSWLRPAPVGRMLAGRDPQARAHLVRRAGGTSLTEAAVARGLVFLARHQNEDGSWSLHAFDRSPDCDETCTGRGHAHSEVAGTALALLPFLGAGQTHQRGKYSRQVEGGLRWLVEHQRDNGSLLDGGQMYAHGQAAIVLCEAYALTGDERLHVPAQTSLDFIVRAQHQQGGWRYTPGQAGDTSVVGWQLMALKSGQMASLGVPPRVFDLAGVFLDQVQQDEAGGLYSYQRRRRHTPAMTAEALLCRQFLGWPKDHPGLQAGIDYLLRQHPPNVKRINVYYWYYATQVMHHFGGRPWATWNAKMRRVLVKLQERRGHAAGSWAPVGRSENGGFADRGGRIYMTSLAVCILEVYYRHLPIYSREVLE